MFDQVWLTNPENHFNYGYTRVVTILIVNRGLYQPLFSAFFHIVFFLKNTTANKFQADLLFLLSNFIQGNSNFPSMVSYFMSENSKIN